MKIDGFTLALAATLVAAMGCQDDDTNPSTSAGGADGPLAGAGGEEPGGRAGNGGITKGRAGSEAGDAGATGDAGSGGQAGAPTCGPLPTAGAGGAGGSGGEALAIVGSYTDDFDGPHEISQETWMQLGTFEIAAFSNDAGWVVARNAAINDYSPCLWSRFDFVEYEGELYVCQGVYDAASESDALAAPAADATDPAVGGCGTYSWSKLTPN